MKDLNAENLKQALWETLNSIRDGKLNATSGDAIAAQSREILRTVNTQLKIFAQSQKSISGSLINFASE